MSNNPYEPSQQFGGASEYAPPGKEKPASVMVFGILNLIFGVLGICGVGGTILSFNLPQNPNVPNPVMDLMTDNVVYMGFMYFSLTLGFIFVIVLIAAGVGLLQARKYGRTLSIVYGWYSIASAIIGQLVNYFFLFRPLLGQAQNGGPAAQAAIFGVVGGLIGGCLALIYPVILLIFMNRKVVKEALR